MENRIVEIARKKAQKNTGKSRQADWKSRDTNPAFFVRADAIRPPTFPPDIKLERRSLPTDSGTALIIPLPLRAVTSSAIALKPAKPASKSKRHAQPPIPNLPPQSPGSQNLRYTRRQPKRLPLENPARRKRMNFARGQNPLSWRSRRPPPRSRRLRLPIWLYRSRNPWRCRMTGHRCPVHGRLRSTGKTICWMLSAIGCGHGCRTSPSCSLPAQRRASACPKWRI